MGRKRTRKEGEWTTISIPKELKKDIDKFGVFGDNYSDIIKRILAEAKKGASNRN